MQDIAGPKPHTDCHGYCYSNCNRDGYRYAIENVTRLREHLGRPGAPVHAISGIADRVTRADLEGTVRAVAETGAVGASLYDWRSTGAVAWPFLSPLRRN